MRLALAALAVVLLVPPAAPAPSGVWWLDQIQSFLHERGGSLDDMGTMTTLTADGGAFTEQVRGHDAVALLAPALGPGSDHVIVPGTWGWGAQVEGDDVVGIAPCARVYLAALVFGTGFVHAATSQLDFVTGQVVPPSECPSQWGDTAAWKDITLDLRRPGVYGSCAGAMLLVEPISGAVGPGERCGWDVACFSGQGKATLWSPWFGLFFITVYGQAGGIAIGQPLDDIEDRLPRQLQGRDLMPCAPGLPA